MSEIREGLPGLGNEDATVDVLQTSLRSAYALLGEIVDQGPLGQQLNAARALGKIARGSQELLSAYLAIFPNEPQEWSSPSEGQSHTPTHEAILHMVTPQAESFDEPDTTEASSSTVSDEETVVEDVAQNTTVLDALPESVPVESDTVPEPISADEMLIATKIEGKGPTRAIPVDEEGFTKKQRTVLTYLQTNNGQKVRVEGIVEDYMQHFPGTSVDASRQAVRKTLDKIRAHPKYADKLTGTGNTSLRRYVYIEQADAKDSIFTDDTEGVLPANPETVPQEAETESVPAPLLNHQLPRQEETKPTSLHGTDQSEDPKPAINAYDAETQDETNRNKNVIEVFKNSVDTAELPAGFVPITQFGIGYVIGENGKKTLYLKDTPHLLKGVALYIFEQLIASRTGEAEFISLKQDIEKLHGHDISIKNFTTAISDLEKRFANNHEGFFSELKLIDKTHFRFIGIRGLLVNEQREEIQRFLAPGSDELHQY